jgi:hypothetical protein
MSSTLDNLSALVKALEAGGYNAAPSHLHQGTGLCTDKCNNIVTKFEEASSMYVLKDGVFQHVYPSKSLNITDLSVTMKNVYFDYGRADKLIVHPMVYQKIRFKR